MLLLHFRLLSVQNTCLSVKGKCQGRLWTLGVVETQCIASIRICPNPTSGELIIDNGQLTIENVEIFDLLGKIVGVYPCGRPVGETIIDIFHLPTGMYFVRILTNEGAVTKKIIKQ